MPWPTQRQRAAKVRRLEAAAKIAAKIRDHYHCQWPGCPVQGRGEVESAHIDGKGMGGDHGLRSALPSDYVTFCREHHRRVDQHEVDLIVGPLRGDGPIEIADHEPKDSR